MRKKYFDVNATPDEEQWLELDDVAGAELTSEDPNFPIESALVPQAGVGWRASSSGPQTIRIVFDRPQMLHRIRLEFSETQFERTQEFTLQWRGDPGEPPREIVRQQWTFSPHGSTREIEDYRVELFGVSALELLIRPDLTEGKGVASLASLHVA